MLDQRVFVVELDTLQRKAHAARRALKTLESEGRAALQLVAQLDDEISRLRKEAQPHGTAEDRTRTAIHA